MWAVAAVAVIAGVAIGRFLTYETAPVAAPPPSARALDDRIADLEQRVGTDPDDAQGWQALGIAYVRRAAETGDPSFYGLAEQALDRAAELVPGDATTLLGQGALALALHRFPEALELGAQVTEELPASADALAVLVDAQVEMGRYDEAEVSLQRMLDLRPGLPALARASYLRELHGDLPGAIEAMTRAESAGSAPFDVANVATLLGSLHYRQGDMEAAAEAYGRALRASSGLVLAEVGRARVLAAEGEVEVAVAALEGVVERFPAPEAVILLGELQAQLGHDAEASGAYALVEALAVLQEAAGQAVDLEMAIFEADRGEDPARAVELARRAHEVRPANVFVNDALAWALFRSGDAPAAVAPMEEALRLGSADPLFRYHAAEIYLATGDTARARVEMEQALSGTPWFSFRHHERVLELAGQLGVDGGGGM
ncbi:MAG: tetratricopeptide repeat protein [Acidimicrobiales bacterium]